MFQFINELIGKQGLLLNFIDSDKNYSNHSNGLQICLLALKCIICLLTIDESKSFEQTEILLEIKELVSKIVIKLLLKGQVKSQDESIFCKVSIFIIILME